MCGFVACMGFETAGKSFMFLTFMTEDYNYYHEFTMAWVDGVGNYFLGLMGPDVMADAMQVMSLCSNNVGMFELHSTFCWFLHYSELKRLVQSHKHEGIAIAPPAPHAHTPQPHQIL